MQTSSPKRQRQLIDFTQYGFRTGLNIADSPQQLADTDLTIATNVYISNEGNVELRRGVNAISAAVQAPAISAVGLYRFYQEIVGGAVSTNAVIVKQVGSTLYNGLTNAVIGTAGQLGAGALPMSCARMFDPSHNGGTDILIICVGPSGGPFAYDGTTLYNLNAGPTTITGARFVQVINAVAFFGGIPSQPNLLVASYINAPEQTPGYNTFSMSSPIQGLGTLGVGAQTSLVVGLVSGIVLLNGFTPNSFFEQEIPTDDGVQAGLSMITVDGVLYFIGNFAIYRYDGTEFKEISRKVRPWILNDPAYQSGTDFPMSGTRSLAWAMEWNRRIYFWYPQQITGATGITSGSSIYTALVWDLALEAWTIYQSNVPLGAGCLLNAPSDPSPEPFYMVDQSTGQTYNFDVVTDLTKPFLVSDNASQFTSQWQTKFFKIGTPGAEKRLLRLYFEFFVYSFYGYTGVLTTTTDYGNTMSSSIVSTPQGTTGFAEFDSAVFDQSTFANPMFNYIKQRYDLNIQAEAFSFGTITPSPYATNNATAQPIFRCMGFTGRISQMPKN